VRPKQDLVRGGAPGEAARVIGEDDLVRASVVLEEEADAEVLGEAAQKREIALAY